MASHSRAWRVGFACFLAAALALGPCRADPVDQLGLLAGTGPVFPGTDFALAIYDNGIETADVIRRGDALQAARRNSSPAQLAEAIALNSFFSLSFTQADGFPHFDGLAIRPTRHIEIRANGRIDPDVDTLEAEISIRFRF